MKQISVITSQHIRLEDTLKFDLTGEFSRAVPGINGIGFLLQAVWTKLMENLTPESEAYNHYIVRLAKILSSNPAEILGLRKVRGAIKKGLVADLVVWKPSKLSNTMLLSDSPYAKQNLYGSISRVYLHGKLAVNKDHHD
jgi:dihydroorotase-like cyclic amidohydrolase